MITPNGAWGGDGSLGCGIGYGYLHRIPIDNPPMPEPAVKRSSQNQRSEVEATASETKLSAASVMPIVPPPMMSSPVVGTMPPPPVSTSVPVTASPIVPPPEMSRASSASPVEAPVPPPSTSTSICSDYTPTGTVVGVEGLASAATLFGTTTPSSPFLAMPPENMVVPDPAVLAGMPPPPMLPDFGNLSIHGMPIPPSATNPPATMAPTQTTSSA